MPGVPACQYGNFGGCYVPEGGTTGASIDIGTTAGAKVTGTFNLDPNQTIARLGAFDVCPNATISTSVEPYQYVEVHNPTSMTAKVSVWGSKTATGPDIDTVMAAYNGFNVPITATARQSCNVGVNDSCIDNLNDPTACLMSWAGLILNDQGPVTIGPFNSALIYTTAYGTLGQPNSGPYILSVRTESIQ
jgi:hypothetical protein